jgi:hypothetical protein
MTGSTSRNDGNLGGGPGAEADEWEDPIPWPTWPKYSHMIPALEALVNIKDEEVGVEVFFSEEEWKKMSKIDQKCAINTKVNFDAMCIIGK